jgi:hypothetical protein
LSSSVEAAEELQMRAVPRITLIPFAFPIEAALAHLAWCRCRLQKPVCRQTHPTNPTGRTSRLLSCIPAVGALRPAGSALRFAKMRSDKNQMTRPGGSLRADSLQPACRLLAAACASCSSDRPRPGGTSCGGCARCLQIERRKATSGPVSVNVRCCG